MVLLLASKEPSAIRIPIVSDLDGSIQCLSMPPSRLIELRYKIRIHSPMFFLPNITEQVNDIIAIYHEGSIFLLSSYPCRFSISLFWLYHVSYFPISLILKKKHYSDLQIFKSQVNIFSLTNVKIVII